MKKLLTVVVCAAMVLTLFAGLAQAGSNTGGTAYIYWLTSNTVASTSRNSTSCTPKCLVTVKGVSMFRGADVQLYLNSLDNAGLPEAWQAEDGGPAAANYTPKIGGWNNGTAVVWPNIFKAPTVLPGELDVVPGSFFYHYLPNPSLAPHNVGAIWLSATGSAGVARTSTKEYGVFGFTMDLTTSLPGDCTDPVPHGVCINPNWRINAPTPKGSVMVVVDASGTKDYEAFGQAHNWLTWMDGSQYPTSPVNCPNVTPVSNTTWGKVRKLYH